MKSILLATDGSAAADDACTFAVGLAAETGAKLHVVSVAVPTRATNDGPGGVVGALPDRPIEAMAAERDLAAQGEVLKRTGDVIAAAGQVAVVHSPVGQPAEEIQRVADDVGADVIVIGSGGHRPAAALRSAFLGSVKRDLVGHDGTTPVVVVKAQEQGLTSHHQRRQRRNLARGLEQVLHEAEQDARWRPFPLRSLIPYQVATAVAPALEQVHEAMADPSVDIDPATMDRIDTFLTDGADSPLYGTNAVEARRVAQALAEAVALHAGV